jgi:hypothetical protein
MNQSTLKTDLLNDWLNPLRAISAIVTNSDIALTPAMNEFSDHVYKQCCRSVFRWDFGNGGNAKAFVKAIAKHLLGDHLMVDDFADQEISLLTLSALKKLPTTIVLSGFESLLYPEGDDYGTLKDQEFCSWLKRIANLETRAFVVIVSEIPVFDFLGFTTFNHYNIFK